LINSFFWNYTWILADFHFIVAGCLVYAYSFDIYPGASIERTKAVVVSNINSGRNTVDRNLIIGIEVWCFLASNEVESQDNDEN